MWDLALFLCHSSAPSLSHHRFEEQDKNKKRASHRHRSNHMAAIQDGANKTQTSVQGLTGMEKLLMDSVKEGKLELVKKILDKGASVDTADEVREQSRPKADSYFLRFIFF